VKQKSPRGGIPESWNCKSGSGSRAEVQRLQAWLALGYQADMDWMNPKRQEILV